VTINKTYANITDIFQKCDITVETMEDRTGSAEISRQGAFRVDSNTNTFVYLACVNMAAIGLTVLGVKTRKP